MNKNFIRYATGTIFAIQLSKAQVRALVGLSVPEDRLVALLNLPHHQTPEALVRKGLVEYQDDKVVLTVPGKLVLKLLDEAGLVPKGRAKLKLDHIIQEIADLEGSEEMVTHYDDYGWPACGVKSQDDLTSAPRRVTCKACKRTKTYKDMMESG